ncbi:MAG: xylose isomerase [Bacteroidetes bacterium]|nr:MAG: xylose isomerase [Bacteroidota bacterium]
MSSISRRSFLKHSSIAITGAAYSKHFFSMNKTTPRLSFSTLGCPTWNFSKVVDFAAANGYQGIELRGIAGELDLTKCAEFSAGEIQNTLKKMEDKQLRFVDLGSSAELHHMDAAKRKFNLDAAKKFIDLAEKINCPFIRVFPNSLPKDQDRDATLNLVSQGLHELAEYAKDSKVSVLLESHGELTHTNDLIRVMQNAEHPHAGMIWDVCNMWTVTKEPPSAVYNQLNKYIRHTHIKDLKLVNGEIHYVLLGQGESPIGEALRLLYDSNYSGYYSFEWEKLWHPEILEPEIALADYPKAVKKYFQ